MKFSLMNSVMAVFGAQQPHVSPDLPQVIDINHDPLHTHHTPGEVDSRDDRGHGFNVDPAHTSFHHASTDGTVHTSPEVDDLFKPGPSMAKMFAGPQGSVSMDDGGGGGSDPAPSPPPPPPPPPPPSEGTIGPAGPGGTLNPGLDSALTPGGGPLNYDRADDQPKPETHTQWVRRRFLEL